MKKFLIIITTILLVFNLIGCSINSDNDTLIREKELNDYKSFSNTNSSLLSKTFTDKNDIVITKTNNTNIDIDIKNPRGCIGLFDLTNKKTLINYNLFETLYPASITKILIAYLVLDRNELDKEVIVSENATNLDPDSQSCNLITGDKIKIIDLLNGMLIYSGNDSANALAEYLCNDSAKLEVIMNDTLNKLGATSTYFDNPNGLHSYNHYSTGYDLYLIFNKCLQNDIFREIIMKPNYECEVTHSNGNVEKYFWESTNYYNIGQAEFPKGYTLLGGKTGTTDEAGSCLMIFFEDDDTKNKYISIILNSPSKEDLYSGMNDVINSIKNKEYKEVANEN